MSAPSILIADDEYVARHAMKKAFEKKKYNLLEAENGKKVLEIIQKEPVDLVFLDINMPEADGFEVLEEVRDIQDPPLIVMVTAYGDEKVAVKAMKAGAYDYIRKPPELDELRLIAENALKQIRLSRENVELKKRLAHHEGLGEIIGESSAMQKIFKNIKKIASTDVTVLIQGENGTGKEMVANEIHRMSQRNDKPFIAVNCAALPDNLIESELFGHEKGAFTGAHSKKEGKFELAHRGTLFLDEIGDMNLTAQAKVLRALEVKKFERLGGTEQIEVDVRVVAATNKNLKEMVEEGTFREDLFYRLNVMDLYLPALRERKEDIPLLTKEFMKLAAEKHDKDVEGITQEAVSILMKHDWPGNVRQLKGTLEKAVILCDGPEVEEDDLPREVRSTGEGSALLDVDFEGTFKDAKKKFVEKFERTMIEAKLKECNGNISQAARELDMYRQSLQQKLRDLNIDPNKFKSQD